MERWPIYQDFRAVMVARLQTIIETGDDEVALKAIAEARHMEAQNQKDEHHKAVKALEQLNNQLATLIGPAAAITASASTNGTATTTKG